MPVGWNTGLETEHNQLYETTVSTVEETPPTAAWFPGAQQQQERPGHPAQSPSRGPQTSDPRLMPAMAAPASRSLNFTRAMRLKQGRDFSRVRQEGQRLVRGCLIANWLRLPPDSLPRLGVVTGGRIGNAVVRNRARRLLREVFRAHRHDLTQPVDLVLVARPSIAGKVFADVEKDFLATLRQTGLLKE
jgi:ribonuclease P protein component